jgi:hypothetical protein
MCQGPPLPDPGQPDPSRTAGLRFCLTDYGLWVEHYTAESDRPDRDVLLTAGVFWRLLDAPRWLQAEVLTALEGEDDSRRRRWRPRRRG